MKSKKNDIVQAAIRLFSKKGYYSTSVEEIAKESGMAKASFYKYFQGKEELPLELCLILVEEIGREITALYSQPDLTPREKLHSFVIIYLENLVKNKIYLMINLPEPSILIFHNTEMDMLYQKSENKLYEWVREGLLDVFGSDIEDSVWDITFVLKSVVFEYIRVFGDRMDTETCEKLAQFILFVTDSLVASIRAQDPSDHLLWGREGWFSEQSLDDPFEQGRQIANVLQSLEDIIQKSNWTLEEKEEYGQITNQLQKETRKDALAAGLLKALFAYLEQRKELRNDCLQLKKLLKLT